MVSHRPIILAALLFGSLAAQRGAAQTDLAAERAQALERWMEARLLLSKEREEWRVQRTILQDRIELLEREIAGIREKAEAAAAEMAKSDEQMQELSARRDDLKSAITNLAPALAAAEARVRALLTRVPPAVAERLDPLSRRIPANPETAKAGVGERFQNVVGILNELNKAAREILVVGEVRELPDGERAEVTTMYLGFAQALYSNEKGGLGGIGTPGPTGWTWEPHDARAPDFATVIGIYRNEKPAAYVSIPARLAAEQESAP